MPFSTPKPAIWAASALLLLGIAGCSTTAPSPSDESANPAATKTSEPLKFDAQPCPDGVHTTLTSWYKTPEELPVESITVGDTKIAISASCAYRVPTQDSEDAPIVPYDQYFLIGGDATLAASLIDALVDEGFTVDQTVSAYSVLSGNGRSNVLVAALTDAEDVNELGAAIAGEYVTVQFPTN